MNADCVRSARLNFHWQGLVSRGGMPPTLSTASSWALDGLLRQVRKSCGTDVPELLSLSARALARAPVPDSLSAVASLSRDDALQLVPVACTACFAVAMLFLNVDRAGIGSAHAPLAPSYFLARVLLLRGMGATYLAGFMTAALQARAIFGSLGIAPADARHVRTVPAFGMLALGLGLDFQVIAPCDLGGTDGTTLLSVRTVPINWHIIEVYDLFRYAEYFMFD